MPSDPPLSLLLSRQAAADFGPRIAEILQGVPFRLIAPDDDPDASGHYRTDIAFLTRDVTGNSGRQQLSASLERFYTVLRASPGLRWLQAHSAGADRPIYGEMCGRGVRVTTASGANAEPVAQMAFTGLLALARQLPALMDAQRRKAWEQLLGPRAPRDLRGQTALVVGMGPIGQEIARLLKAIHLRVIGVRRTATPCGVADEVIAFGEIDRVLPQADWVLLACPLSDQTRGLMHAGRLAALPRGAGLVNVARGEVVIEHDLVAALKAGQLGGAYLDVFEREPLDPDAALWTLPNVLITPHTAGHTQGHYAAVGEIFLDNLARWRDGVALRNPVAA